MISFVNFQNCLYFRQEIYVVVILCSDLLQCKYCRDVARKYPISFAVDTRFRFLIKNYSFPENVYK